MRGDKAKWIRTRDGTSHNMQFGSNCGCWMCKAVTKWVDAHHWTSGRERERFAERLLTYLCYRMGFSGCEDVTTLDKTLPDRMTN